MVAGVRLGGRFLTDLRTCMHPSSSLMTPALRRGILLHKEKPGISGSMHCMCACTCVCVCVVCVNVCSL